MFIGVTGFIFVRLPEQRALNQETSGRLPDPFRTLTKL
jgi:hypothetical protein